MNRFKIYSAITLLLSVGVSCFADANDEVKCLSSGESNLYQELRRAVELPSIWPGFDPRQTPIALEGSEPGSLILMNVSSDQLREVSVSFHQCSDFKELQKIKVTDRFADISNGIYEYVPLGDREHEGISRLVDSLKQPALILSIKTPSLLPPPLGKNLARTLIHELFHLAYQYNQGFNLPKFPEFPNHRVYELCSASPEWLRARLQEGAIISEIRASWSNISDFDLWAKSLALSQARDKYPQTTIEGVDCIQAMSFWERVEGTAHYIDLMTGLGIDSYSSIPVTDWGDGSERQFYYKNGATSCLILDRLFPGLDWRRKVEGGQDPSSILKEALRHDLKPLPVNPS